MEKKLLIIKTLLLTAVVFVVPAVVFARPADPSRFPTYTPLRPPMENVRPNYEGSANFTEKTSSAEEETGSQNNFVSGDESAPEARVFKKTNYGLPTGKAAKTFFWLFALAAVGGLIWGYAYWRKRNRNKKTG
jgi:membrane protease YdiL (CAAX protease family)